MTFLMLFAAATLQAQVVPMPAGTLRGVEIRINGGTLVAAGSATTSLTIGDKGIAGPFEQAIHIESMGFINEQLKAAFVPLGALQKAAGASGRFELSGATLRAVPVGSCSSCALVIQQQGTVSDGVRIVFEDGKPIPLIPVADVARALGGKLSSSGGVYAVTAGGCGACVLGARP